MSVTTTYSPDKDTYIDERSLTTNYGTSNSMKVGRSTVLGDTKSLNAVLEFDISALTDPTAIFSATLNLVRTRNAGANTNTVALKRLAIGFVEASTGGCTWQYADTTDTDTAWAGGTDYAKGEPKPITFNVGATGATVALDIRDFVLDALFRRAGILRLVIDGYSVGTDGSTTYGSSRHITSASRPTLDVVTADRLVWKIGGGTLGSLLEASNWDNTSGGSDHVPTISDYAYFTGSNNTDASSGTLTAANVYVGRKYRGNIGTSSSPITVTAHNILYSSPYSEVNLDVNEGKGFDGTVRIGNTNITPDTVKFQGETTYRLIATQSPVVIAGSDVSGIECHSARASFTASGTVTSVNITEGGGRLQNGATSIYAVDASLLIENTDYDATAITQMGGFTRLLADTTGNIIIYAGTLSVRGNEGAPITLTNLTLYPSGLADLRTKSNTIETTNPIQMYGGRILLDGNVDATIA